MNNPKPAKDRGFPWKLTIGIGVCNGEPSPGLMIRALEGRFLGETSMRSITGSGALKPPCINRLTRACTVGQKTTLDVRTFPRMAGGGSAGTGRDVFDLISNPQVET